MEIEVTQEDINVGLVDDCNYCPIALAVMRLTGSKNVSVLESCVPIIVINNETYTAPPSVIEFVENFDKGFDVEPFGFSIDKLHAPRTRGNG